MTFSYLLIQMLSSTFPPTTKALQGSAGAPSSTSDQRNMGMRTMTLGYPRSSNSRVFFPPEAASSANFAPSYFARTAAGSSVGSATGSGSPTFFSTGKPRSSLCPVLMISISGRSFLFLFCSHFTRCTPRTQA